MLLGQLGDGGVARQRVVGRLLPLEWGDLPAGAGNRVFRGGGALGSVKRKLLHGKVAEVADFFLNFFLAFAKKHVKPC